MVEFIPFRKVPRLSRDCTITEKLDGTNALVYVGEDGEVLAGRRNGWLPADQPDNHGFRTWVEANHDDLLKLGVGYHFGEWWGGSIQRRYGQQPKRFSLFNTHMWTDPAFARPACCDVVPILWQGPFSSEAVDAAVGNLRVTGSVAVPGCMKPEGVMVYHHAAKTYFKKTLENDEAPKGALMEAA